MAPVLRGVSVLNSRPFRRAEELSLRLRSLGAEVYECPLISIRYTATPEQIYAAAQKIERGDWIVFTSSTAVRRFFGALDSRILDRIADAKIASVGGYTSQALSELGRTSDFVASEWNGAALAAELAEKLKGSPSVIHLPRAAEGDIVLPQILSGEGHRVEETHLYTVELPELSADNRSSLAGFLASKHSRSIAIITSEKGAENFETLAQKELNDPQLLENIKSSLWIAPIGPNTARRVRTLGFNKVVEARGVGTDGVIDALREWAVSCGEFK